MEEIWKDIPGYEGLYQVSNFGEVKSLNYKKTNTEKIFKPSINDKGYYRVTLSKDGKIKTHKIHQLVAMVFLNHKPNGLKLVVNHIDNNPLNNNLSNLELKSQRYNSQCHKTDVGITWYRVTNKWKSAIYINKKHIHLGYFSNKDNAMRIYQTALNNIHIFDGDSSHFRKLITQLSS